MYRALRHRWRSKLSCGSRTFPLPSHSCHRLSSALRPGAQRATAHRASRSIGCRTACCARRIVYLRALVFCTPYNALPRRERCAIVGRAPPHTSRSMMLHGRHASPSTGRGSGTPCKRLPLLARRATPNRALPRMHSSTWWCGARTSRSPAWWCGNGCNASRQGMPHTKAHRGALRTSCSTWSCGHRAWCALAVLYRTLHSASLLCTPRTTARHRSWHMRCSTR